MDTKESPPRPPRQIAEDITNAQQTDVDSGDEFHLAPNAPPPPSPPRASANSAKAMPLAVLTTSNSADLSAGFDITPYGGNKSAGSNGESGDTLSGHITMNNTVKGTPVRRSRTRVASTRKFLTKYEWPPGLINVFLDGVEKFPIRFFLCDDSTSMNSEDGNRLERGEDGKDMFVECTRWEEITDALRFHMQLSIAANAPAEFHFLNRAEPFVLGNVLTKEDRLAEEEVYAEAEAYMSMPPAGATPICGCISAVLEKIKKLEAKLRKSNKLACVIIMTDGEPTDGVLAKVMAPFKYLPVWVVVRLCTDDAEVTKYWNHVDKTVELSLDVLDDYQEEASEVMHHNPWLTYGLPLQRVREFGIFVREIDIIDECPMTMDEADFFTRELIFGDLAKDFPSASADFAGFARAVTEANGKMLLNKTFCPDTRKQREWISHYHLKREFKDEACCPLM